MVLGSPKPETREPQTQLPGGHNITVHDRQECCPEPWEPSFRVAAGGVSFCSGGFWFRASEGTVVGLRAAGALGFDTEEYVRLKS